MKNKPASVATKKSSTSNGKVALAAAFCERVLFYEGFLNIFSGTLIMLFPALRRSAFSLSLSLSLFLLLFIANM